MSHGFDYTLSIWSFDVMNDLFYGKEYYLIYFKKWRPLSPFVSQINFLY